MVENYKIFKHKNLVLVRLFLYSNIFRPVFWSASCFLYWDLEAWQTLVCLG